MIGNDVVDIEQARRESNWQRRGYLQKIFTPAEQAAIASYPEPELMVWIFWSMKEAAYKIWNRQTGKRAYIPHLLECEIISFTGNIVAGSVKNNDSIFHTQTTIGRGKISSVAAGSCNHLTWVKVITPDIIYKDFAGLPYIIYYGLQIPVSVSHHGKFRQVVMLNPKLCFKFKEY